MDNNQSYAYQSETRLLGCLLNNKQCQNTIIYTSGIGVNDFSDSRNKTIWNCLIDLAKQDKGIDKATVLEHLKQTNSIDSAGGAQYLTAILTHYEGIEHIKTYVRNIKEASARRTVLSQIELLKVASTTQSINDVINENEKSFLLTNDLFKQQNPEKHDTYNLIKYLDSEFSSDLEAFSRNNAETGFEYLDDRLGKLYPGIYSIGAISSLGKTTWMAQIADQLCLQKIHCVYFSIEQSAMELIAKSLSRHIWATSKQCITSLNIRRFWNPKSRTNSSNSLTAEQYSLINDAYMWYREEIAPYMHICGQNFSCTLNNIKSKIKVFVATNDTKPVMFVDYLQIITPEPGFRGNIKEHVDNCMTELERLAKDQQITIFIISSLNRASYLTPVSFESFKESGSVEYSSDVILTMQLAAINELSSSDSDTNKREILDAEKNLIPRRIEMKILKNRYGRTDKEIYFLYYPDRDYFENVDKLPPASDPDFF